MGRAHHFLHVQLGNTWVVRHVSSHVELISPFRLLSAKLQGSQLDALGEATAELVKIPRSVHLAEGENEVQNDFPEVGVLLVNFIRGNSLKILNSQEESYEVQIPNICLV